MKYEVGQRVTIIKKSTGLPLEESPIYNDFKNGAIIRICKIMKSRDEIIYKLDSDMSDSFGFCYNFLEGDFILFQPSIIEIDI